MNIYDLMNLFVDEDTQLIEVYDINKGEEVFKGYYTDMPDEYDRIRIHSIDNIENECLTINIL